jgi:glyoxylase-like metal-dependent hydrolase (beta-lactamase superfamily II)
MNRRVLALCVWFGVAAFSGVGWAEEYFKVVPTQGNIFVLVPVDGVGANTSLVITDEGVAVIDTGGPGKATEILTAIGKLTNKPVRFAINTGYRGDHVGGNREFRAFGPVLAHKDVLEGILKQRGGREFDLYKRLGARGLEEAAPTLPNLIFENGLEWFLGKYRLQALPMGRTNTPGDTVVYLKEYRILIAGDLILNKTFPDLSEAYIDDWITALRKLEELDAEMIVPGHGDVGDKPLVFAMKHFFLQLKALVSAELARGAAEDDAVKAVLPVLQETFSGWKQPERLEGGIRRAYREFQMKIKTESPQRTSPGSSDKI